MYIKCNTRQDVLRAQTRCSDDPFRLHRWYETNFT